MNELALFAGAGGGILGSKLLGHRIIGYVENNEYCQKVLRQRIEDGILDEAPIFGDIRAFNREGYAAAYTGLVDVVSGGFPCQDISCAGKGAGIDGERSGLWSEMADTIRTIRPRYVLVENSPILTVRGLGTVLGDLSEMGFDAAWSVLGAHHIGGKHKRERLWVVADSMRFGLEGGYRQGRKAYWKTENETIQALVQNNIWAEVSDPRAYGSDDGVADRVERTQAIGNGQVPVVAATAFRILSGVLGSQ